MRPFSTNAALNEFHTAFGYDAADGLKLRKTLVDEEYNEVEEEFFLASQGKRNLRDLYKELADLVYVIYGADAHLGNHLDRVLEEVHRSNMTKLWHVSCTHCDSTGREPQIGKSYACTVCHGEKEVRKREDGKILKPPTYEKANLSFVPETL